MMDESLVLFIYQISSVIAAIVFNFLTSSLFCATT